MLGNAANAGDEEKVCTLLFLGGGGGGGGGAVTPMQTVHCWETLPSQFLKWRWLPIASEVEETVRVFLLRLYCYGSCSSGITSNRCLRLNWFSVALTVHHSLSHRSMSSPRDDCCAPFSLTLA